MRALVIAAALAGAGCAQPELPALQGWSVQNPTCVLLCWSVNEITRDGAGGAVELSEGGMT